MTKKNILTLLIASSVIFSAQAETNGESLGCELSAGGSPVENPQVSNNETCQIINPEVGDVFHCKGLTLKKVSTDLLKLSKVSNYQEEINIVSIVHNRSIGADPVADYDNDGNPFYSKCNYLYDPKINDLTITSIDPLLLKVGEQNKINQSSSFSIAGTNIVGNNTTEQPKRFHFGLSTQFESISNIDNNINIVDMPLYTSEWEITGLNPMYRHEISTSVSFEKVTNDNEYIRQFQSELITTQSVLYENAFVSLNEVTTFGIEPKKIEIKKDEDFYIRVNNNDPTIKALTIVNTDTGEDAYLQLLDNKSTTTFESSDPLISSLGLKKDTIVEFYVHEQTGFDPQTSISCSKKLIIHGTVDIYVDPTSDSKCTVSKPTSHVEMLEAKHHTDDKIDIALTIKLPDEEYNSQIFGLEATDGTNHLTLIDYNKIPAEQGETLRLLNMPLINFSVSSKNPMHFYITGNQLSSSIECDGQYILTGRHRLMFDGKRCYQY